MENIAIVIRGPSAVGKSTIASLLHKEISNSAHIDVDVLKRMVSEESSAVRTEIGHNVSLYFVQELIKNGFNIIIEEIFRDENFSRLSKLLNKSDYRLISFFITVPLPVLIERDKKRTHKVKGEGVVSRLYSEITPRKGDIVIDMSNLSNEQVINKMLEYISSHHFPYQT